jgi:hypothetical protein
LSISAVVPVPKAVANSAPVPVARTPAAMPWPILTWWDGFAPSSSRHRLLASTAPATGPPTSRIQASATSGSTSEPGSHGLVA